MIRERSDIDENIVTNKIYVDETPHDTRGDTGYANLQGYAFST